MIIKKVKVITEEYPEYEAFRPRIGNEYWVFNKVVNSQIPHVFFIGIPYVEISIHYNYSKWYTPMITVNNCKDMKISKDEILYIKSIEEKFNKLTKKINNIKDDTYSEIQESHIHFKAEKYENFFHEKAMEYFWGNERYKSRNSHTVNSKEEYYNLESQRLDLIKRFIKGNWI